jgi:hypothetical protein
VKVLEYCIHAVKYYEGKEAHHDDGESSSLNLVISLHVLAALHCQLGQYEDAVSVLERSLTIPDMNQGEEHALAIFAGHMQLGDTLNLAGKQGPALQSYHAALQVQKSVVGEFDLSVAETCNYIAEAHLQVSFSHHLLVLVVLVLLLLLPCFSFRFCFLPLYKLSCKLS